MRITPTPAVGLIATHAALSAAVHGVTGTLVGTSDVQTLDNKTIGGDGLTFYNPGTGDNPILASLNANQFLTLTGWFELTKDIIFKSGTAFQGAFTHAISANRNWVIPDVAGNFLIDADTGKSVSFLQLTIENAGAGGYPVWASNSAAQQLNLTGQLATSGFLRTDVNLLFKSGTAFVGTFDHAISEARTWTFPNIAGTVCMWNAANAAVTRYYSGDANHIWGMGAVFSGAWTFPNAHYVSCPNTNGTLIIPVFLPHGAIVTALRIASILTNGADSCAMRLFRKPRLAVNTEEMARCDSTTTLEEISDTSIANATVDNDTYAYEIQVFKQGVNDTFLIYNYQIDYTVTSPYP